MNWNMRVRQVHRWVSLAFTVAVAANFLALALGEPAEWVYLLPLLPLVLLMITGLCLFAQPYLVRRRGHQVVDG